ncbi:MAG TPA: VOC family protein [Micromonosporaceae bacterium]
MASYVWTTTVDCGDPYRLSVWWSEVLDYAENPEYPNHPEDEECLIRSPAAPERSGREAGPERSGREAGHQILFIRVPESKSVKNRVHFDLRPADRSRDEEVTRLVAHGATVVDDLRKPDGKGWVVLADPEGNEFCVLRGEAEIAASA